MSVIRTLIAVLPLLGLATAAPVAKRDLFNGTGNLNLVNNAAQTVGCLNDAGQFVVNRSLCGVFTGVVTEIAIPGEFGYPGYTETIINITSPAGPCGAPFTTGSEYEEGHDYILSCAPGATTVNPGWEIVYGVNSNIGKPFLELGRDSEYGWNSVTSGPPTGDDAVGLEGYLGVSGSGAEYYVSWGAL